MNRRHIAMLPAACNSAAPSPAVPIGDGASRKRLFDARKFVEAAMARQAARSIDDAHLARLKDALEANRRAIGDRTRFMQTDIEFHRILFLISGNPIFRSVHAVVVSWLMKCWGQIDRDEVTERLAFQGHAKVSDAVARGDPDAAERAMNQHLSASWSIWTRQFRQH
jgi:DNA-binding FadR family transcriptional regulator